MKNKYTVGNILIAIPFTILGVLLIASLVLGFNEFVKNSRAEFLDVELKERCANYLNADLILEDLKNRPFTSEDLKNTNISEIDVNTSQKSCSITAYINQYILIIINASTNTETFKPNEVILVYDDEDEKLVSYGIYNSLAYTQVNEDTKISVSIGDGYLFANGLDLSAMNPLPEDTEENPSASFQKRNEVFIEAIRENPDEYLNFFRDVTDRYEDNAVEDLFSHWSFRIPTF